MPTHWRHLYRGKGRWLWPAAVLLAAATASLAVVSFSSAASEAEAADPEAKVEQQLLDDLEAGNGTATFWVYLREQADLGAAPGIASRDEQGWFVYRRLTETAERSQAGLLALLEDEGVDHESFWIANTVKVTGDADLVNRIAARPEVAQITADRVYELPEPIPAEEQPRINAVEWGLDRINAPQVWDQFGVRGEDIVVGAIDTGALFTHAAIVNQYRGNLGGGQFDHNYNWHDPSNVCGNPSLAPCDNNGHGTHVTGTMVGDDGGANQIGVAPAAKWIIAKGCESTNCSNTALLSAGQFILAPTDLQNQNPDPTKRPHIVNNSWGGGANTDPWYQPTVQAWVAAGIFPQFANGNNIPGCTASSNPGNLVESYAAGAFDINNAIAGFSNRGPSAWGNDIIKPNVSAPGVAVRSAWNNGDYNTISGTSMASPHVAGTVALMWSAAASLERDIETTRELLDLTATDTSDLSCGGTPQNNNVWGEGRLNAFLAVEDSPRGPTGRLLGTVTDDDGGDPIAGATVKFVGEVVRERTTDAEGDYAITLPVGVYAVTASAFGYAAQTVDVTVVEGDTTRNFALVAVDNITVSGQITDGSGHGWPMYAKVSATGTPRSTYTNPLTGEYSLELPAQATYNLRVESQYPGYADKTETVEVGDDDITLDLELIVDRCALAPGYEFGANVGVAGDFNGMIADLLDGRGIPSSVFRWGDDPSQYDVIVVNRAGDPGQAAFLDFLAASDAAGTGVVFLDTWSTDGNGVWLLWQHVGIPSSRGVGFSAANPYIYYEVLAEHPVLDGFQVGDEVVLATAGDKDHAWFGGYEGEGRMVIGNAGRADTGIVGQGIGVQERANNRHVLLSMHGVSTFINPSQWTADGAQVFLNALLWAAPGASFECLQVDGGLVLGHVTDMNTSLPINGATVASVGDPSESGKSFPTAADPALDDGFYWLFSSLTGSRQFTASAGKYVSVTKTVNVAADTTNEASFVLPAGQLSVNPTAVEATHRLGLSSQRTFVLRNTGTAPVDVELGERKGSFVILGGGGQAAAAGGAEVRYVEGEFSPAAAPREFLPTETPTQPGPSAPPWTNLPAYPTPIMDNSAAAVDDKAYSFGGFAPAGVTANAYVFDPATNAWSPIASLPGPRQKSEAVDIDGRIYIVGGWDAAGTTTSTLFIYDPATDSYSQGASMPAGRTAPGAAALDGQLYVVGGCTTNACSPMANSVWRYDPAADSWETLANYPRSFSWLGCGGLEGQVYCAGGTDGSAASTATYAYDPGSDSWTQQANMPYDNWAMAYAAANGQLVISGGVTQGFAQVTNRSAAYDPGADTWTEIQPANHTVYRMGSACGFYKLGGSTGGFSPSTNAERHPDFAECLVDVDVPWLSVAPTTATLQPGQSLTVTVSMDGAVAQPGTYTAGIGVRHSTPYKVDPVGVTMIVTPPNQWGKIAGTVTGVSCKGEVTPLVGATVQVNGGQEQLTLRTDAAGGYARWMSTNNNPLTMIATHAGFQPQTRQVQLKAKKTVTENFHLQAICSAGQVP